jgi:mRNA-degrading endonuclease RelE of RelBE toxin-antitoxin system
MAPSESDESDRDLGPYLKRSEGPRHPPGAFAYKVRGKNRRIEERWDKLCAMAPNNARRCFDHLARNPNGRPIDTDRVVALKGRLVGILQYEVASGARVWYVIDDSRMVVTVLDVHTGHPKQTE